MSKTLRLQAYCGVAAARKALGIKCYGTICFCGDISEYEDCPYIGCLNAPERWLESLLPFYIAATSRECGPCHGSGVMLPQFDFANCPAPGCERGRISDPNAFLKLTVAVGWVYLPIAIAHNNERLEGYGAGWCVGQGARDCVHANWEEALRAADDYIKDPSAKSFKVWVTAWNMLGDAKGWIPAPGDGPRSSVNVISLLMECYKHIGLDAVKHVVLELVTVECQTCIGQGNYPDAFCMARKPPGPSVIVCEDCSGTGRVAK